MNTDLGKLIIVVVAVLAVAANAPCQDVAQVKATKIRVAIYCDQGSLKAAATIEKCLAADHRLFTSRRVKADEIRTGILKDYDVIVQGGGSGSKQAATLEDKGRDEIRKFVQKGGGYLGICAGAYLATNDYTWSLGILKAQVVDKRHWARGAATVRLQATPAGTALLGLSQPYLLCKYHQGPLLKPADAAGTDRPRELDLLKEPDQAVCTPIMLFASEVAEKGAPHGVMIGATAMATARYGKGRVFVSSPHPEATPGLQNIVRTAVRWLAHPER